MKPITPLLVVLLVSLVIIATFPYTTPTENFSSENLTTDINLNLHLNNNGNNRNNANNRRPRVIVPVYAPWRMYYPYESVYQYPIPGQYQSSPFYPFFDQYNIYQNMMPWNN
jgi:hypothetical protein